MNSSNKLKKNIIYIDVFYQDYLLQIGDDPFSTLYNLENIECYQKIKKVMKYTVKGIKYIIVVAYNFIIFRVLIHCILLIIKNILKYSFFLKCLINLGISKFFLLSFRFIMTRDY